MRATLSDTELAQFRAFVLGAEILHDEITVTSAEILALFTTPKELVATPGTRYVHEFISAVLFLDHGGTDYTTRGDLTIGENDGSGTTLSDTLDAADFVQASADAIRTMQVISTEIALSAGAALVLCCATGNPAAGNSPIRVNIAYRTHATGL
jgi:hypothetical protein